MSSIQRFEFTTVYTHPEAAVDIIFLHGLHGSPSRTWRANPTNSDGTTGGVFWPTDLLPKSLEGAPANIILYGYNADLISTSSNPGGPSQSYMVNHAQNLVTFLTLYRHNLALASGKPPKSGKTRPILWVAHSLGGILLEAALNYSNGITDYNMDDQRGIYVSTYGMIFLGTPHVGTDLAEWGLLVQRVVDAVVPKKLINTEGVLLKTLRGQSETIVNINHQFNQIRQRFKIHYAYETLKTSLKGIKTMVVEPPDAVDPLPGTVCYGIESTHSDMCRFDSPTAPGYVAVSTGLRDWVLAAPSVIQKRWEFERDQRWRSLCLQVTERFMEMELPASPSVHVESCRSLSACDVHPHPPSIDDASCSGPSSYALWNASSPSLLAPPSQECSSTSPRKLTTTGEIDYRLRQASPTGNPPSVLEGEWARMLDKYHYTEGGCLRQPENTALRQPANPAMAASNALLSRASCPGVFTPGPASKSSPGSAPPDAPRPLSPPAD